MSPPLPSPIENKDDVLNRCEIWLREGRSVAIATVTETKGSAPQPVGAHLIVDSDGNFAGSVSGGCVEGDVITHALEVIGSQTVKELEYTVSDAMAWEVGLTCGGTISVRIEPIG